MDNQKKTIKILIADDHELFLQGLEFILKKEYPEADITLTDSYTGIFKILETERDFDLILTDLAMPGAGWREAIAKIHNICQEVPIIIISAVFEPEILQETYNLGVSGYVSKSFSNSLILSAINLVMAGGMYIPQEIMKMGMKSSSESVRNLIRDLDKPRASGENNCGLTPRQTEVLECMAEGLSNKQIAYKLGLSEGTVKIHITLLMRTLEVTNRTAAVRKAAQLGILKIGQ
ncbi:MAG: response regulator transcription factor [Alphaproteobacteria bacterium]|nr:response regulator transcription factor [Alphaproteobacteria bacterium]